MRFKITPDNGTTEAKTMALILSIIYASGGQGKTTAAEFLAEMFQASGYKTLAVDLEPQHSLSNHYRAVTQDAPTLTEVMLAQAGIEEAVQKTEKGDIIPSTRALAAVEEYCGMITGLNRFEQLALKLDGIEDEYDIILIDTPTELRFFTVSAAMASDGVVIPVDPKKFEIETYRETVDTLRPVMEASRRGGRIYGAFLSRVVKGRVLTRESSEQLEAALREDGLRLLPEIGVCEEIAKAQAHKVTLFSQAPRCEAIGAFVRLAAAILEEYRKDMEEDGQDEQQ